jgi:DNA polymerase III epsilon subunit family exonuclease
MRKARQISKHKHKSSPEKYLILDVETTGLSAKKHEIIEISALKIEEREIKAEFHAFVKAKAPVPPSITELTGISNEMLEREGREITDVLPGFLEFAGNLPVVSHNADFDYGFLRSACERCSLPLFSNKYVDTLTLARRLIDDVKNYKLTTLLDYFGIEKNCVHRSTDDCLNTKQLYEKLIELQQEEK